jgi:pimeloyl-ACP methyl ester carboxylesterase
MMPRIRFCRSADGARIAFGTMGSGPPILAGPTWLTHLEFDWDVSVWKPWYRALSANHTLVRFDLRGCGLSDRNVEDFSIERFVADMDAVADAIQLDRFPLVGICQGGPMAAAYAARHPERVGRLLLYGSYAQGGLV